MSRVCRVGGQLLLIDIVAPEEPALAERYNRFERLRDTTHTTALAPTALTTLVSDAGFAVVREFHRDVEMDLQNWLDFTQAEPQVRVTIERAIQEELHGGTATGMRPYVSDGRLKFLHLWWVIIGRKG